MAILEQRSANHWEVKPSQSATPSRRDSAFHLIQLCFAGDPTAYFYVNDEYWVGQELRTRERAVSEPTRVKKDLFVAFSTPKAMQDVLILARDHGHTVRDMAERDCAYEDRRRHLRDHLPARLHPTIPGALAPAVGTLLPKMPRR